MKKKTFQKKLNEIPKFEILSGSQKFLTFLVFFVWNRPNFLLNNFAKFSRKSMAEEKIGIPDKVRSMQPKLEY